MRIVLVGGGSGGHVTPLAAVAGELVLLEPKTQLYLVTDKNYLSTSKSIFENNSNLVKINTILAGKFRRYANKSFLWYFIHPSVLALNTRDLFYTFIGVIESFILLYKIKPNVIFCKGGFVCVPVSVAARMLKIPIVLHDSDTVPGLAARVISRWATAIAVGANPSLYSYPKQLMYYTGTPISSSFKPVSSNQKIKLKKALKFNDKKPLLLVVGGGTGATGLNSIVAHQARSLLKHFEIVHFAGKGKTDEVNANINEQIVNEDELANYHVYDFTSEMHKYLQVADVIVSRAGATAIQEIAAVGKPLILVPGSQLTGGHQIKNAQMLLDLNAAKVLSQDDLDVNGELLVKQAIEIIQQNEGSAMIMNIKKLRQPRAALDIANLILSSAKHLNFK